MILYLTTETVDIIRKYYTKQIEREYEIISVAVESNLLACKDYKTNKFQGYILYKNLLNKLLKFHRNPNIKSVVYIVDNIDEEFLRNFKEHLDKKYIYFTEINLIDYSNRLNGDLYKEFTKII